MKEKYKTCPRCDMKTCYTVIQIETDEEPAYMFDNCQCGYHDNIYEQVNEYENKDFYKNNQEAQAAKKYLNKLKGNRERVKKFREKNERKRISIDYLPGDFENNLKQVCNIMGTSQAKALNELMFQFLKSKK
jgi:hypothetical protein